MKKMHNDIKEILLTTEQIEAKAAELAKQLEIDYADKKPVSYTHLDVYKRQEMLDLKLKIRVCRLDT